MIIAPSVEITLTFHLILSSWHDYWLLAASELHWQHFILHVMPVSYLPTYLPPPAQSTLTTTSHQISPKTNCLVAEMFAASL